MTSKIREAAVSIGLSLALGFALPAIALADETGDLGSSTSPIEEQETSVDEQSREDPIASISEDNVPEVQTETDALIEQAPQDNSGADEAVDSGEVAPQPEEKATPTEAATTEETQGTEEDASESDDDAAAIQLMDVDAPADESLDDEQVEEGPLTGWETVDGQTYYRNDKGERLSGLQLIDGEYYYFDPSTREAVKSWCYIDGKTYHFDTTTYRADKYSKMLGGYFYYFSGAGVMHTGWLTWTKDNTRSFFAQNSNYIPTGAAFTGWVITGGKTYYFRPTDYRAARYSNKLHGRDGTQRNYYFNGAGAMQTGFVTFGDGTKSYYDPEAGKTYGAAVTGWKTISGKTYYFQPTNLRAARWTQNNLTGKDGKKHDYYFNSAGVMAIGAVNFGNTASLYNADGAKVVAQGWYTINSDKYYVRNQSPVRYNQTIDGKKYYFYGTYKLHRGWIYFSSTKTWAYYDDTTGAESTPQPGWSISGGKYYFYTPDKKLTTWNKNTYTNWVNSKNKTSGTKYLLTVNLDTCYMNVFEKSGSLWVPIKGWMVSVGNDEAGCPTPKGEHVIGSGMSSFKTEYWPADGDNCAWYATIFYHEPGRWTAFHSVIYKDYSKTKIKDPRLGYHITGSCVRMATENAIWIYNNIGRNTKAYIY